MFRLLTCLLLVCTPAVAQAPPVLVFAASSLTDALSAVGDAYAAQGQPKPAFSFASSAALARQIENGAPAAIFISADEQWMDYVAARNLIAPSSRDVLLSNRLVLVAPASSAHTLKLAPDAPLKAVLNDGKLALADPDSVPAGRYAKAALENLGLWRSVANDTVRADNVRAALAFVERGEANAGIVYATDAAVSQRVTIIDTFPEGSHPPITYPIALLGPAPTAGAQAFFDFVRGQTAREIYRSFGFVVN